MPYKDLREYIDRLQAEGELCSVRTEVDWNLEMGAVSRRAIDLRARAILFENVVCYRRGYRAVANMMSATRPVYGRFALAMGLPKDTPTHELIEQAAQRIANPIKPVVVRDGPCKEEVHLGDDVNVLEFPVPFIHGTDGGRFIGTWHIDVNKDPDTGWVNWGMYRHMVHDAKTLGWLASNFQHGPSIYLQKYEARGKPMPMAIAIGTEPMSSVVAATPFNAGIAEVDIAGGLRGAPVELVKCETIDLEVPATSEIVLEGMVFPGERLPEGSFGEYTGYDSRRSLLRPVFRVQCITHRKNPILTVCNPGKPLQDNDVVFSIAASAAIASELKSRGIPFKSLYVLPTHTAVAVAARQPYGGFVQTLARAIWSTKAGVCLPYIFVVGEDVDVTDSDDLLWCLTTRLHPENGIHVVKGAHGLPLYPFLSKEERGKGIGPNVLFDATFPHNWPVEDIPTVVDFEHGWPLEVREKVLAKWKDYGIQ